MSSIFSKIIKGEIPSFRIYEDELTYAFLDINPASKGHTLVVPKTEVDLLWDLDQNNYKAVFETAKMIALALKKTTGCVRVGMAVVGLEVPHAHIHLIPLNSMSDFSFSNKLKLDQSELKEIQNKIISNL